MPEISVTIPTYNRSMLVKEAIQCVLDQTEKDLEVIVIDDGSTDDTRQVVESFEDRRVQYFYKDNGGCSSARNAGLEKCTGRYIAFLDSDDLWPGNFLEVMVSRLQDNPEYGCVYCSVEKVDTEGRTRASYGLKDCRSGQITEALFKRSFIWLQAAVFTSKALEGLTFDQSVRNGGDTDVLLRLSTKIKFLYIPDIMVKFRMNHGVAPRRDISSLNCNRIRFLERFYFRLGGDQFVSRRTALRKLSHAYYGVARNYYKLKGRRAAIELFKQAIRYLPGDVRLYWNLIKAYCLKKSEDRMPDWSLPEPLPAEIE